MHSYPQRVCENILPLSEAGTLPEAFQEWGFTEETEDHGTPSATCELCDKESLRYQFRIRNLLTGHTLWVGSQCILQFELSVFEKGARLSSEDAKKKLERLTNRMRLESCIKALTRLAEKERGPMLKGALDYYLKNKVLTPKYGAVVLWQLDERKIDHSPSFFKISLKRDQHKEDLRTMKPKMFSYLWPALSSTQKKTALEMGRKDPTKPTR